MRAELVVDPVDKLMSVTGGFLVNKGAGTRGGWEMVRLFHGENGIAENLHFWGNSEAWSGAGGHESVDSLGGAIGGGDGDVAIEVGAREAEFFWGTLGEMGDGGGGDVSTPGVFESHADTHGHAEVASLLNFGQSTEFANFQVHEIHGEIRFGTEEHIDVVDIFIENEGVIGVSADGETFFISQAGLFDVDIDIPNCPDDADGFVLSPAGIGVGDEAFTGLDLGGDRADASDIGIWVASDFELEASVAFGTVGGDLGGHFFGGFLGDCSIEADIFAVATSHEDADGEARGLSEDIPAGDIDARFDVGVAFEGGIHEVIEFGEFEGIFSDEMRSEFPKTRADALGVSWKVKWSEGADFAVTDDAGVGFDANDGAVEDINGLSAGPFISGFVERQSDAVGEEAGNFHR